MNEELKQYIRRLDEARNVFIDQIESCTREQRSRAPESGWNMLQVMEHVLSSEKGTLEYMKRKTQAPFGDIPIAGDENSAKSDQLVEALKSDKKWKAPTVLPDPTGAQSFENMLAYWDRLREEYEAFLNDLDPGYFNREIFKHPFAGRLNLFQTLDFLINHLVHHVHQINRLCGKQEAE